jgi:hypothetical protein
MTEAARVLDEAIARAPDPRLQARAQVEREFVRLETDTSTGTERSRRVADLVLPVFQHDADEHGESRVWSLHAYVAWVAGEVGSADAAWCNAADSARRAGDERELFDVIGWRAMAAVAGPTPVDEAIDRCEGFRDLVSGSPVAVAWTFHALAVLHAMRGEFELAAKLVASANDTLYELGSLTSSVAHQEAMVRLLAGQPELAEQPLRAGVKRLASMGDGGLLATTNAMLAQAVYAQGRLQEAAQLCAAASGATDDIVTQVIWRGVQAKILARDGHCEEAMALAREAVTLVEPTDLLSHHGDAMLDLAEVLRTCRCGGDECLGAAKTGLALYESKGNTAAAARARSLVRKLAAQN